MKTAGSPPSRAPWPASRTSKLVAAMVGLLPACGGAKALESVKAARADKEAGAARAALRALAAWPGRLRHRRPPRVVAHSTEDNAERVTALRGCVWLLENATEYSSSQVAARFEKVVPLARSANEREIDRQRPGEIA